MQTYQLDVVTFVTAQATSKSPYGENVSMCCMTPVTSFRQLLKQSIITVLKFKLENQHHSKSANQYLISRDLSLTTMKLLKQPSLVRLTFVESNAFSATQMSLLVMKRRKLCNVSNVGVLLYSKTWTATNFGMLLF